MIDTKSLQRRNDVAIALAALVLLLLWEASGWDRAVAGWYGNASGFAMRDQWWLHHVLHDGGRLLSGVTLLACAVLAWHGAADRAARRLRLAWFGFVLLCLIAIPAFKRVSSTSCPWDLQGFGGTVPYVPHWLLSVTDGGPGHCFPSGHAVAAFAFLPLYFQWRNTRPLLARTLLSATLALGTLFGWAQLARGAHFPSHTLWSAWLCWVVGAVGARWLEAGAAQPLAASLAPIPASTPAAPG